jgi:hypothetical protein
VSAAAALTVEAIPTELTAGKRFVAYRLEDRGGPKPAKMPYAPDAPKGASHSNSAHGDGLRPPSVRSDGATGCACDCCRHDDGPEVARLRRLLLERDDLVEAQRHIITTQRTDLEQLRTLREEDRRLRLAEKELGRLKTFSTVQKDAIKVAAGLSGSAASRGNEAPIITRAMVAGDIGCHEATAGAALKVFDLEGSPVRRDTHYQTDEDGTPLRKKITRYRVETASPADIIEAMVEVGRGLESRQRRYLERRCPEHPDAGTVTQTVCAECGLVLNDRPPECPAPAAAEDADARYERLAPIGETPPAVAVPVTPHERLAPIGVPETNGHDAVSANGNGHDSGNGHHDRAALEMVATPLGGDRASGDQDYARSKNGHSGAPRLLITSKVSADGRPPPIPPGPCRCDEVRVRQVGGRWLCSGCGGVPVPLEAGP